MAEESSSDQPVLLVEDNPLNQMVAEGMLRLLGCSAEVVHDGVQALRALEARPYRVVLMDVHMPGIDGFEATRRIRAQLPAEHQPYIIAHTANAIRGDAERCLAAGMDDYLAKPITKEALRAALERSKRA